jgi:hypothetical protein
MYLPSSEEGVDHQLHVAAMKLTQSAQVLVGRVEAHHAYLHSDAARRTHASITITHNTPTNRHTQAA